MNLNSCEYFIIVTNGAIDVSSHTLDSNFTGTIDIINFK